MYVAFLSSIFFLWAAKNGNFLIFELKKISPSWSKMVTSRAEPSWKYFSSSYGSSQLGSGSSLQITTPQEWMVGTSITK